MDDDTSRPEAGVDGTSARSDLEDSPATVEPASVLPLIEQTDGVGLGEDMNHFTDSKLATIPTSRASNGKRPSATTDRFSSFTRASLDEAETFFEVFGYFGLPMVAIFVFSALWTFTLAFIQMYPNEMANAIMNTTQIDDGQFWLLPQPDAATIVIAVVLLVLFGLGYLWLGVYMVIYFRKNGRSKCKSVEADTTTDTVPAYIVGRVFNKVSAGLRVVLHYLHDLPPLQRHYYVSFIEHLYHCIDSLSLAFNTVECCFGRP